MQKVSWYLKKSILANKCLQFVIVRQDYEDALHIKLISLDYILILLKNINYKTFGWVIIAF